MDEAAGIKHNRNTVRCVRQDRIDHPEQNDTRQLVLDLLGEERLLHEILPTLPGAVSAAGDPRTRQDEQIMGDNIQFEHHNMENGTLMSHEPTRLDFEAPPPILRGNIAGHLATTLERFDQRRLSVAESWHVDTLRAEPLSQRDYGAKRESCTDSSSATTSHVLAAVGGLLPGPSCPGFIMTATMMNVGGFGGPPAPPGGPPASYLASLSSPGVGQHGLPLRPQPLPFLHSAGSRAPSHPLGPPSQRLLQPHTHTRPEVQQQRYPQQSLQQQQLIVPSHFGVRAGDTARSDALGSSSTVAGEVSRLERGSEEGASAARLSSGQLSLVPPMLRPGSGIEPGASQKLLSPQRFAGRNFDVSAAAATPAPPPCLVPLCLSTDREQLPQQQGSPFAAPLGCISPSELRVQQLPEPMPPCPQPQRQPDVGAGLAGDAVAFSGGDDRPSSTLVLPPPLHPGPDRFQPRQPPSLDPTLLHDARAGGGSGVTAVSDERHIPASAFLEFAGNSGLFGDGGIGSDRVGGVGSTAPRSPAHLSMLAALQVSRKQQHQHQQKLMMLQQQQHQHQQPVSTGNLPTGTQPSPPPPSPQQYLLQPGPLQGSAVLPQLLRSAALSQEGPPPPRLSGPGSLGPGSGLQRPGGSRYALPSLPAGAGVEADILGVAAAVHKGAGLTPAATSPLQPSLTTHFNPLHQQHQQQNALLAQQVQQQQRQQAQQQQAPHSLLRQPHGPLQLRLRPQQLMAPFMQHQEQQAHAPQQQRIRAAIAAAATPPMGQPSSTLMPQPQLRESCAADISLASALQQPNRQHSQLPDTGPWQRNGADASRLERAPESEVGDQQVGVSNPAGRSPFTYLSAPPVQRYQQQAQQLQQQPAGVDVDVDCQAALAERTAAAAARASRQMKRRRTSPHPVPKPPPSVNWRRQQQLQPERSSGPSPSVSPPIAAGPSSREPRWREVAASPTRSGPQRRTTCLSGIGGGTGGGGGVVRPGVSAAATTSGAAKGASSRLLSEGEWEAEVPRRSVRGEDGGNGGGAGEESGGGEEDDEEERTESQLEDDGSGGESSSRTNAATATGSGDDDWVTRAGMGSGTRRIGGTRAGERGGDAASVGALRGAGGGAAADRATAATVAAAVDSTTTVLDLVNEQPRRRMTAEERMVRNREAAAKSRARRHQYQQSLEAQILALQQHSSELRRLLEAADVPLPPHLCEQHSRLGDGLPPPPPRSSPPRSRKGIGGRPRKYPLNPDGSRPGRKRRRTSNGTVLTAAATPTRDGGNDTAAPAGALSQLVSPAWDGEGDDGGGGGGSADGVGTGSARGGRGGRRGRGRRGGSGDGGSQGPRGRGRGGAASGRGRTLQNEAEADEVDADDEAGLGPAAAEVAGRPQAQAQGTVGTAVEAAAPEVKPLGGGDPGGDGGAVINGGLMAAAPMPGQRYQRRLATGEGPAAPAAAAAAVSGLQGPHIGATCSAARPHLQGQSTPAVPSEPPPPLQEPLQQQPSTSSVPGVGMADPAVPGAPAALEAAVTASVAGPAGAWQSAGSRLFSAAAATAAADGGPRANEHHPQTVQSPFAPWPLSLWSAPSLPALPSLPSALSPQQVLLEDPGEQQPLPAAAVTGPGTEAGVDGSAAAGSELAPFDLMSPGLGFGDILGGFLGSQ